MPPRSARLDVELVEDLLRLRVAGAVRLPLRAQPYVDLFEPVVRVEDAPHDELRRYCPVPPVLLQSERDVVAADAPVAVELRALPERDRPARVAAVALHSEAKVLAL